jgi:hypothetical protein
VGRLPPQTRLVSEEGRGETPKGPKRRLIPRASGFKLPSSCSNVSRLFREARRKPARDRSCSRAGRPGGRHRAFCRRDAARRNGRPGCAVSGTSTWIGTDAAVPLSCTPAKCGGRIGIGTAASSARPVCPWGRRSRRPPTAQLQRGKEVNPHEIKRCLNLKWLRALRCTKSRPLSAAPIDELALALMIK